MKIDVSVLRAVNNYNSAIRSITSTVEQLSSGTRIGRAANDSAAVVLNAKLRAQLNGLQQAMRNAQEGYNVITVAEGALGEISVALLRVQELATAAANKGVADSGARNAYDAEAQDTIDVANKIAERTMYATKKLLDGTFSAQQFMIDDDAANVVTVSIADSRAAALGVASLNLVSDAQNAMTLVQSALSAIENRRSQLGAFASRFSVTVQALQSTVENLITASSRISDTDIAQAAGQMQRDRAMVVQGARALDQAMAASVRSLRVLR
jgi:flagellin